MLEPTPANSGPASLRIHVQPPSPAVIHSDEHGSPVAAARDAEGRVGSSASDFISAVTAATSPEQAADRGMPGPLLSNNLEQAVRELIERSLPPTPPSEPDTLAPHDLAQQASSRQPSRLVATDTRHTRPPTVASTLSEDPIFPRLPDPRPWDLVTQRLYAWASTSFSSLPQELIRGLTDVPALRLAVLWQEESFTRTLEDISLDAQGP